MRPPRSMGRLVVSASECDSAMLTPYIFFNLIMGVIGVIQSFDTQYVMTSGYGKTPGGPVDSTLVPVLYLFQNAFSYFKMGYASAIAWLLFIVILILTLLQLRMAKLWFITKATRGTDSTYQDACGISR